MDRVEELLQHICSALDTLNENIEGMKRMSEEDKEMLDSIKGRWLSQKWKDKGFAPRRTNLQIQTERGS